MQFNTKPIPGFDGYEITADGVIWSSRRGDYKIMKPYNIKGYLRCGLRKGGKQRNRAVHRLVARAWIGPPPFDGAVCRHLDDDKLNNHYTNLAWGTVADNVADAIRNGVFVNGSRNGGALVTDIEALEIVNSTEATSVLAERYGMSKDAVTRIRHGRSWKHIDRSNAPPRSEISNGCERERKLTDDQAMEALRSSDSDSVVGRRFGVAHSLISQIRKGKTYKEVYSRWQHDKT